jgi:Putative transposase
MDTLRSAAAACRLHVLPGGFHRIRHYGLLANGSRKASLALARELLHVPGLDPAQHDGDDDEASATPPTFVCAHCGRAMTILQTFTRGQTIRAPPQEDPR